MPSLKGSDGVGASGGGRSQEPSALGGQERGAWAAIERLFDPEQMSPAERDGFNVAVGLLGGGGGGANAVVITGAKELSIIAKMLGIGRGAGALSGLKGIGQGILLKGASAPLGKGGSVAGAALQAHATRAGSWLAQLAQGGSAAKNAAAAEGAITNILQNGTSTIGTHKVFGEVIRVRLADGAGAWWKTSGEFIGFLERYTPR